MPMVATARNVADNVHTLHRVVITIDISNGESEMNY
jgi:hypothetical protein